jgi:hypothetical protein
MTRISVDLSELLLQEREQVERMEEITDLLTFASKAGIFQRPLEVVVRHPKREDALIYFAKLTRAGQNAAPVDDRSQSITIDVLLNDQFRRQFGGPIKRPGKVRRKIFTDSSGSETG